MVIPFAMGPPSDFFLQVQMGLVPDMVGVNKFGRTTNADNGVATDIWDRANATQDQDIWLSPTAARIHAVVSSHADDDSAGDGMRTLRLWGLQTWSSAETSEDIILDGTSGVNTDNSYVIIHRMHGLTFGANGVNTGVITATAASDSTVTAQINAAEGQAQMAIFGIPSGYTGYMLDRDASVLPVEDSGAGPVTFEVSVLVNPEPDVNTVSWLVKETFGMGGDTATPYYRPYPIPKKYEGPCIIKMQAICRLAINMDVLAGFNIVVIKN